MKEMDEKFGRDGSKLLKMKGKDFNEQFNLLFVPMKAGLDKTTGRGLLKEYSPWLHTFQANAHSESIEVPGMGS